MALNNPPEMLKTKTKKPPPKMEDSRHLAVTTSIVLLKSNIEITTIVIILASPSLMPGMPYGIGICASISETASASATKKARITSFLVFDIILIIPFLRLAMQQYSIETFILTYTKPEN